MKVEFLHTRLGLTQRFIAAGLFYTLAALLLVFLAKGGTFNILAIRFAALGLLLLPLWFLRTRSFSNKIKKKSSLAAKQEETWQTVTMTDLDRVRDKIKNIRETKIPAIYSRTFGIIATFFFAAVLFPVAVISGSAGIFAAIYIYLLFFPFLWFARLEKWYPLDLAGKIDIFAPVLEASLPDKFQLSPVFCFNDDSDGIPNNMRLMLTPGMDAHWEKRNELLGVQFQISYNKGEHGTVPYVYAVFITRGTGGIWQSLGTMRHARYETEAGSSKEGEDLYGTVVLRQDTESRPDGYHTKKEDVKELAGLVIEELEKL